jgi:hypothetical protein
MAKASGEWRQVGRGKAEGCGVMTVGLAVLDNVGFYSDADAVVSRLRPDLEMFFLGEPRRRE